MGVVLINEEEFLKEHPGLKDAVWDDFPIFRAVIHKTQLDKQKVTEVLKLDGLYAFAVKQMKKQKFKNPHETAKLLYDILEIFIDELKKELGLE